MDRKILFLKRAKLLILLSRLSHSITYDRKNEFLKKVDIEPRYIVNIISCSVCCPSGGDFIKEILRRLIFVILKNSKVF